MCTFTHTPTLEDIDTLTNTIKPLLNTIPDDFPTNPSRENVYKLLAHYLWQRKGSPDQDLKNRIDDYFAAKSLYPVLVTDEKLANYCCNRDQSDICPFFKIESWEMEHLLTTSIIQYYFPYHQYIHLFPNTTNPRNSVELYKDAKEKCSRTADCKLLKHLSAIISHQQMSFTQYKVSFDLDKQILKDTEITDILDAVASNFTSSIDFTYHKSLSHSFEEFVLKQAQLFWQYKNIDPQTKEDQDDDYYKAKKFIAFYITEKMISYCTNTNSIQCPINLLDTHDCYVIDYLSELSVEEYLRFRAYLKWIGRGRRHGQDLQDFNEASDYLHSTKDLCKKAAQCRKRSVCFSLITKIKIHSEKADDFKRKFNHLSSFYNEIENNKSESLFFSGITDFQKIRNMNICEYFLSGFNCPKKAPLKGKNRN